MELNYTTYKELKDLGASRADIAEFFEIPEWKLKKHIAKENWGKPTPIIENETAFDEYSEEACYWAGFLAADGNVDSKKRIRLTLKYDDLGHIEKYSEFLKSTYSIWTNIEPPYYKASLEFTNSHICEILEFNYNIIPNKTTQLKFPKHIPDKYLKHYIRGYFDGDGSICESFSNKNSTTATLYATFCSGCEEFIIELYNYLTSKLNLGGYLQEFNDSVKWQIKFNTNDAKTLLRYMYEDSNVYLDRKYAIYQRTVVEDNRKTR